MNTMDTNVLNVVVQPFIQGLLSYVIQASLVAIMGLGLWGLTWVGKKLKGNVVGEALFNLALRYLHAKAEDPKAVGGVVEYLKKHKPTFINDVDFDSGMRSAMSKAQAYFTAITPADPK